MHATTQNLAPQTARTPDPREVLDDGKKRQFKRDNGSELFSLINRSAPLSPLRLGRSCSSRHARILSSPPASAKRNWPRKNAENAKKLFVMPLARHRPHHFFVPAVSLRSTTRLLRLLRRIRSLDPGSLLPWYSGGEGLGMRGAEHRKINPSPPAPSPRSTGARGAKNSIARPQDWA